MKESRERMDEDLDALEEETAPNVKRYGRIAAVTLGVAALAGVGFLVYRRFRRRSRTEQVRKSLVNLLKNLPDSVREMAHGVASRFREPLPSVKVVVNGNGDSGSLASIVRKVASAVVGTASTAVLEQLIRTPDEGRSRTTPPEYS